MSDPDPVPIRVLDDLVKLLLGGSATKEGMGQDMNAILIIDTDGTVTKNDTLKSAFDGADRFDESWSVHSHSLQDVARTAGPFESMSSCSSLPPSSACVAPELSICGGRDAALPLERRTGLRQSLGLLRRPPVSNFARSAILLNAHVPA